MKTYVTIASTISCLALYAMPVLGSDIYKWVDVHGVVHYADGPSAKYSSQSLNRDQLPYLHIEQPPDTIPAYKPRARPKQQRPSRKAKPDFDCKRFRGEIGKLEATLRKGYSEPAGSRMRERKRHWTSLLYKHCY